MKITINTAVLGKEHLTLEEFLTLLMGFYDVSYNDGLSRLVKKKLASYNVFDEGEMILSDNTKDLVSKILLESDDRIADSKINFTALARKMQDIFPEGCKAGTTYSWRGRTEDIAQKLRALVVAHNFSFTEEEALGAAREYVDSFNDKGKMQLLKYFILKTKKLDDDDTEIDSMLMTIIENNR